MFVIADIQFFFSEHTGMFIICGHTRVHMCSSTDSLVIAIKLKGEETLRGHHVVNLHSTKILPE
jgi:hypothetical protein